MSCTKVGATSSLTRLEVGEDGGRVRIGQTLTIPVALALLACASETDPHRAAAEQTATSAQPAVSDAPSCSRLGEDLGAAGVLEVGETCSLEVKDAGVLDRLGLTSSCPPGASIVVPLVQSDDGWRVDLGQLQAVENGSCLTGDS